jgi:galactose mutarotase-like enzyme
VAPVFAGATSLSTGDMPDMIELRAGDASALIDPHGAQWRAWSVGRHELLWSGDPAIWDATAPILFPVVGWTRNGEIRVDGKTYPLGLHGFAATRRFDIAERHATFVRLVDRADEDTHRLYPFDYTLEIVLRVEAAAFSCEALIRNEGAAPMPYAFGFHPGFRWPGQGGSIRFDRPEAPHVPVITSAGLFSSQRRAIPVQGNRLPLSHDLLAQEALCFLDLASRGFVFARGDGLSLRVDVEDFPHAALWSRPPAPFLCIESWTGHGDPEDFAGDLAAKPSMRVLGPGAEARHAARYALSQPA